MSVQHHLAVITILIIIHHTNVQKSMGKPCSWSYISYCKSQRICISTTSYACYVWTYNKIRGLYYEITIIIVPSYTGKNITRLLPLALLLVLRTRNNTDGNKLVIFSGIASYNGDNYIVCMWPTCSVLIQHTHLLLLIGCSTMDRGVHTLLSNPLCWNTTWRCGF